MQKVVIDRRFNGPSGSGNGGYVAGLLGREIQGAAEVKLFYPPPLERSLIVERDESEVRFVDGSIVVAKAVSSTLELDIPRPPSYQGSIECSKNYRGFSDHAFPNCFVCGPNRGSNDGLRIFAGPCKGRKIVSAPFYTFPSLFIGGEVLPEEYLWAAMDCPGAFAIMEEVGWKKIVLGTITAEIENSIDIHDKILVIGWYIGKAGRKYYSGTALFSSEGDYKAGARSIWIEIP